jgi:hypothetical protein
MKGILQTAVLLFLLFAYTSASAQENSDSSKAVQAVSDSIDIDKQMLADLKSLLDSISSRTSFFSVSLGVGNRLFSIRNNNFNAQQVNKRIAFTPSAAWYHHSGFGLSAVAFLSKPEEKLQFYQYAFSPSYDNIRGKKFSYGVSYTYYLVDKKTEQYATPFRHEGFAYMQSKKGWLRTGLSAGYGKGHFVQVSQIDTVIFNIPRLITDTTKVGLQDFSLTASVSHPFEWDDIFKSGDGFSITPQVMVAAGAQTYDVNSKKSIRSTRRLRIVQRSYNANSTENTGLRFQTVAASVNLSYYSGSFSISPSYFFSYYLPESDEKTSHVFSITAGFIF